MDCVPNEQMPTEEIKSEVNEEFHNDESLLEEMTPSETESSVVKQELLVEDVKSENTDAVPPEIVITVDDSDDSTPSNPTEEPTDPVDSELHCLKCDKSFVTVDAYELHCSMHKKTVCGSHRCRYCQKNFQWSSELARHEQVCQTHVSSRLEVIQEGELFICPKCFKSFAIRQFCITHINRHYKQTSREHSLRKSKKSLIIKCSDCARTFISKASFDRHSSVHRDAKMGIYKCKICGKDNNSNYKLTSHSLKVHGKFQMAPTSTTGATVETISKKRKPAIDTKKL